MNEEIRSQVQRSLTGVNPGDLGRESKAVSALVLTLADDLLSQIPTALLKDRNWFSHAPLTDGGARFEWSLTPQQQQDQYLALEISPDGEIFILEMLNEENDEMYEFGTDVDDAAEFISGHHRLYGRLNDTV